MGIQSQGHSNYSREGTDIVCSAVSTLLQTFAIIIAKNFKHSIKQHKQEKGTFILHLSNTHNTINAYWDFLITGLNTLQYHYKQYINIEEVIYGS